MADLNPTFKHDLRGKKIIVDFDEISKHLITKSQLDVMSKQLEELTAKLEKLEAKNKKVAE